MASYTWPARNNGVDSLNGETGEITLVGGTGITITPAGQNITITATGAEITFSDLTTSSPNLAIGGGTGAVHGSGTTLTLTGASLVEATSSVLTITGGANCLIGTGASIQVKLAATAQSGYLSSTDWNTFNGKQASGNYITALTGDGTAAGPGSSALTLATVNSTVGSFGGATTVGSFTVNAKGLVTAAASTAILIAESQVTNLVSDLAGKQATGNYITALTGDVTASGPGSVAATLAATANATLASLDKSTGVAVHGTNTNNSAASGYVGEYLSVNSPTGGTATPGSSGAFVNVASISLTAGDWDVSGMMVLHCGGTFAGGTQGVSGGFSLTTANLDTVSQAGFWQGGTVPLANGDYYWPLVSRRMLLSTTTTVYLVAQIAYTVLGATTWGSQSLIQARRMR